MLTIPTWNASLSVGNPEVDQQHKQLLTICQRFVNLLRDPEHSPTELTEYVNDVAELMQRHFTTEESLLRKHHCPNLDEHVAEHTMLYSAVVLEISNVIAADKDFRLEKFNTVMTEWLSHHLLETDMRDKAYLVGR